MGNLIVAKTGATPETRLDASTGILELRGVSYPEDTAEFHARAFKWLRGFLDPGMRTVTANTESVYFSPMVKNV